MTEHITAILSTCSSSTCALRLLRSHRLQPQDLNLAARATVYSSLDPLLGAGVVGIRRRGGRHRLERLVVRMRLPNFPDLATLVEDADTKLFNSIPHNSAHVLRHYLTDKPVPARSLRAMAHNFVLPPKDNRNFVSRALYEAAPPTVSA